MIAETIIKAPILHSLDEIFHYASNHNLPIAIYRLPGEAEPHTLMQTDSRLTILSSGLDALGHDGFVVSPWENQPLSPAVLIKADRAWKGWETQVIADNAGSGHWQEPIPAAVAETSFDVYEQQVSEIKSAIQNGRIEKAILSRVLCKPLLDGFNPVDAFRKAATEYPDAFCYLVNLPGIGQWLGASPELLASVHGNNISTMALAGTRKMEGKVTSDIKWNDKELHEQKLVTEHIFNCLQNFSTDVHIDGPHTKRAGNLLHLQTTFNAVLPESHSQSVLRSLLYEMHPSPAIAGKPKAAAIKVISEVEKHDRAYYGGFLGPVGPDISIEWFVNLRCMRILQDKVCLYVGGGITSGSDALAEWKETEAKADTLLNILS